MIMHVKVKKLKLPVMVGPLSAVKLFSHTLTLTFPGNWATFGKWHSDLPGETISFLALCAANMWHPGISNLHRDHTFRVPIHILVERSLGDSFFVP